MVDIATMTDGNSTDTVINNSPAYDNNAMLTTTVIPIGIEEGRVSKSELVETHHNHDNRKIWQDEEKENDCGKIHSIDYVLERNS